MSKAKQIMIDTLLDLYPPATYEAFKRNGPQYCRALSEWVLENAEVVCEYVQDMASFDVIIPVAVSEHLATLADNKPALPQLQPLARAGLFCVQAVKEGADRHLEALFNEACVEVSHSVADCG